jgi:hypothetical protein
VGCTGGDEQLFAGPKRIFSPIHLEFFFAFDQHHELVGFMDEVVPDPPRRVDPQVARKSARNPTFSDLFLIHRRHELIVTPHPKDVKT